MRYTGLIPGLALLLAALPTAAQPGTIDASYGTAGWATSTLPNGFNPGIRSLVVLPDGSSLAVATHSSEGDVRILHLDINGQLDTTYADSGVALIDDPNGSWEDELRQAVLMDDGRLLIGGSSYGTGGDALACMRLMPDGSLDSTFGTNGITRFNICPNDDQGQGLLLLSTGKILLFGFSELSGYHATVARLNADGTVDATFNGTGYNNFNPTGMLTGGVTDAVEQPDGRIVVCGFRVSNTNVRAFATRFLDNGLIDPTFTSHVYDAGAGLWTYANSIVLQPDGKLVIGVSYEEAYYDLGAFRILDNGDLDSAFATNGFFRANGAYSSADGYDIQLRPNGNIVCIGSGYYGGTSSNDIVVAKADASGLLEPGFGTNGIAHFGRVSDENDQSFSSAYQADGKLLIGGISANLLTVLRVEDDLSTSIALSNPFPTVVTLRFDPLENTWWLTRPERVGIVRMELFDAKANMLRVSNAPINGSPIRVHTTGLPMGTYLLRSVVDGRSLSERLIVFR